MSDLVRVTPNDLPCPCDCDCATMGDCLALAEARWPDDPHPEREQTARCGCFCHEPGAAKPFPGHPDGCPCELAALAEDYHCGCCGEQIGPGTSSDLWCVRCLHHVSPAPYLPLWERTYFGQHEEDCPFQVGTASAAARELS